MRSTARAGQEYPAVGQSLGNQTTLSIWSLDEVDRLVSVDQDPAETLRNIVRAVQSRFGTDACSLYLLESERATLVLSAAVGIDPSTLAATVRVGDAPLGVVAETRVPWRHDCF